MIKLDFMYQGSFTVLFESQKLECINKNEVTVMSRSVYPF